jgi:bacillithiol biosynthesis cysteine-adding enzyme BshC
MPLFSIASEDHDWAEVDHANIIDTENRLVRLSLNSPMGGADPEGPTPSIERIQLGPDIEDALGILVQGTPNSEFKVDTLDPLRAAYRPGRGLAEAFRAALGHLLRRYRFLLVPTAHPHVKRETRGIMWQEWQKRHESEALLQRRADELVAGGFRPQVSIAPGATNLFVEGRLGRDRLLYEDGGGRLRRSSEAVSEAELRRWLEETPERVSPGALLRPVTEAGAFPVLAYVGGPGEIAYLAQSQVLFDLHDIPAPVVVPRNAFRLIESKVARVLDKYGLDAGRFSGDSRAAINRLLDEQTPSELQEALAQLRRSVTDRLKALEAAALEFDPGSRSALGSGASAVFDGISVLETKLQARVREKNQVMQQQLEKAAVNLYPDGRPQERVLSPYPFLVRYGEKLVDELYDATVTPLEDGDVPQV